MPCPCLQSGELHLSKLYFLTYMVCTRHMSLFALHYKKRNLASSPFLLSQTPNVLVLSGRCTWVRCCTFLPAGCACARHSCSSCDGDEGVKHRRGFPAVRKGCRCFQQPTSSPSRDVRRRRRRCSFESSWLWRRHSRADGVKRYLMPTVHSDVAATASRSARVQAGWRILGGASLYSPRMSGQRRLVPASGGGTT